MAVKPIIVAIFGIAVVFYLVVPSLGAFVSRSRWRRFRAAVIEALAAPVATEMPRAPVLARLVGTLEATEGDDTFWIRSGSIAAAVTADVVPIHLVPSGLEVGTPPRSGRPEAVYWAELAAMTEGTPFMVYGRFVPEAAGLRLDPTATVPLLLAFEDRAREIGVRCVWAGRQANEFWNDLTPSSLVVGFLALVLLALRVSALSRGVALLAITTALVPILPLFPPGVIGLYVFRRLWARGRRYRAIRDVLNVPAATNAACVRRGWDRAFVPTADRDDPTAVDLRGLAAADRDSDPAHLWESRRPHMAALRAPCDATRRASRYGSRAVLCEIAGALTLLAALLCNYLLVSAALNALTAA